MTARSSTAARTPTWRRRRTARPSPTRRRSGSRRSGGCASTSRPAAEKAPQPTGVAAFGRQRLRARRSARRRSSTTPSAATIQNETRQCDSCRITAPSSGPTMGAMPPTPAITFSTRTSWAPVARSTITARPMTMAQPPAKPWTNRATVRTRWSGRARTTTDAAVMATIAAISGRRRPRWSETGPPTSWPRAMPTKNVVKVSWTWVAVADRSAGDLRERRHVHVGGQRRDRGQEHHGRDHGRRRAGPDGRFRLGCGWSPRYSQSGQ